MNRLIALALSVLTMFLVFPFSTCDAYVIGEEDVLNITVWGSPELSIQIPVRPDGKISVPLLGDVKASGMTPEDLKTYLQNEYSKYVKSPTVSVVVTSVNSFKVYVFGEGISRSSSEGGGSSTSGAITLRRNTTLLQLLAQVGSMKDADLKNAYLLRDGQRQKVDFHKLIVGKDISQDVPLKPNDVIYIPNNFENRIRVVGAVRTPGIFPYTDGMTALDAVLSAGGFTEYASQNNVVITRKEGTETKSIDVKLKDVIKDGDLSKNVPLKPGDIVSVKTGIW